MEVGKTYRFANPALDKVYGEWIVTQIRDDIAYSSEKSMCYTRDLDSIDSYGRVLEVNVGPEPYEEWFK